MKVSRLFLDLRITWLDQCTSRYHSRRQKTGSGPDMSRKTKSMHVELEKPLKYLKRNVGFMGMRY